MHMLQNKSPAVHVTYTYMYSSCSIRAATHSINIAQHMYMYNTPEHTHAQPEAYNCSYSGAGTQQSSTAVRCMMRSAAAHVQQQHMHSSATIAVQHT